LWPNGWMHQDATWYGGRPKPRLLCVRWGPSPGAKTGVEPPVFGPYLLWPNGYMEIKMPLGTEVGFSPCDIVLDVHPAPLPKKGTHPAPTVFSSCPLWPNGWMDQDATWYGGKPQPR